MTQYSGYGNDFDKANIYRITDVETGDFWFVRSDRPPRDFQMRLTAFRRNLLSLHDVGFSYDAYGFAEWLLEIYGINIEIIEASHDFEL